VIDSLDRTVDKVLPSKTASNGVEAGGPARTPIKLVAIDLDGTLLNTQKKVSEQTVSALRCLPADLRVV